MKMKSQHAQVLNRMPGFSYRSFAFERIDRRPSLNDAVWVALLHGRYVIVRARRWAHRGCEIKRDENRFHACSSEVFHYLTFALGFPGSIPIFGQRVDVGLLAANPFLGVGITMNVNDSHAMINLGESMAP